MLFGKPEDSNSQTWEKSKLFYARRKVVLKYALPGSTLQTFQSQKGKQGICMPSLCRNYRLVLGLP